MHRVVKIFREIKVPFSWERISIMVMVVISAILFLVAGALMYTYAYTGKVLPGVHVGGIKISGMQKEELKNFLQAMDNKLVSEGVKVYAPGGKEFVFYPVLLAGDDSKELLTIDVDQETDRFLTLGKNGDFVQRVTDVFHSLFSQSNFSLINIKIDRPGLAEQIKSKIGMEEIEPSNAGVLIKSLSPSLSYDIVEPRQGKTFAYEKAVDEIAAAWLTLTVPEIILDELWAEPKIVASDVESALPYLANFSTGGTFSLVYHNPDETKESEWKINLDKLQKWLEVQKTADGTATFGLNKELVMQYLKLNLAPVIDVPVADARFKISNDKVTELYESHPGLSLNLDKTYESLNQAILDRSFKIDSEIKVITASVDRVEPLLNVANVNDFGITEILGVGKSFFAGSPTNRVKNIENAVKKLNGILIPPGSEFSTITYTAPFTTEDGYLPELVIKGDALKAEVGGGLCQVGTTLFRMAMNSGMEITERRNHSLVVNYYGDLRNGLPGTDATVYEPSPDFKFKNDTGNYVLLQTEIDKAKSALKFTLWGKSDGRTASYGEPKVIKWIEHGDTRIIESDTLPAGEKKCQHAFRGASASFVYTRIMADGITEDKVFQSYYRPLPEICLVGKGASAEATSSTLGLPLAEE